MKREQMKRGKMSKKEIIIFNIVGTLITFILFYAGCWIVGLLMNLMEKFITVEVAMFLFPMIVFVVLMNGYKE